MVKNTWGQRSQQYSQRHLYGGQFLCLPSAKSVLRLNDFATSRKCGNNEIELGHKSFACLIILEQPLENFSHLRKKVAFQKDTFIVPSLLQQICLYLKSKYAHDMTNKL